MLLSIPLQNFNCKDNTDGGQKSSTPILYFLKICPVGSVVGGGGAVVDD